MAFDSLPQNSPARRTGFGPSPSGVAKALVVGGGRDAAKIALGAGLDATVWDSIFGAGTAEAVGERMRKSPADAYTRQGWFRRCVDYRAKAAASVPWGLYEAGSEPGDYDAALWTERDPSPTPDLAALANLPRVVYLAEASLALAGACYFGKAMEPPGTRLAGSRLGRFAGLRYWSPYTVAPEWNGGRMHFRRTVNGEPRAVDPDAVVWAWQPDPLVEIGPGSADGAAAAANAAALGALTRFLGDHLDGGLVKMTVLAIENGQTTTAEQRSDLRSLWSRILRRGASTPEGPPVLNANVKPHVIGEGLKDLANEVLTREQRQAVCTAFGIPWGKMMDSDNYATAQVYERGFLLDTAFPQARIVQDALNEHLLRDYGLELRFEPERHETMQQYELEKAEKVTLVCGGAVLSVNEGRQLLGKPAMPGAVYDEILRAPSNADGLPDAGTEPISEGSASGAPGDGSTRSLPAPTLSLEESLRDRIARVVGEGY